MNHYKEVISDADNCLAISRLCTVRVHAYQLIAFSSLFSTLRLFLGTSRLELDQHWSLILCEAHLRMDVDPSLFHHLLRYNHVMIPRRTWSVFSFYSRILSISHLFLQLVLLKLAYSTLGQFAPLYTNENDSLFSTKSIDHYSLLNFLSEDY